LESGEPDVRNLISEVRGWRTENRNEERGKMEDRRRMTENGGRKSEDRRRMTEDRR
jgi:hypothetical protein